MLSAFLCVGRFLALLSTLQRVVLTKATGAGETASQRRSALAGPVVNNASALFESLETALHFFWFLERVSRRKSLAELDRNWVAASFQVMGGFFHF